MRSPVRSFGGKGSLAPVLLKYIPKHITYVEVFGGAASLLFAKQQSPVEVYNDVESGLVNFFRVLRNKSDFRKFHHLVSLSPFSREEFYYCKETWRNVKDPVEKARRWYVVARQCFHNSMESWQFSVTTSNRNMSGAVSAWLSAFENMPAAFDRFRTVQVESRDWRKILEIYDTPDTFFYLDPPYVLSTRSYEVYEHEIYDKDHKDLIDAVQSLSGKVMISGYDNDLYKKFDSSIWKRVDFDASCCTLKVGSGRDRIESLWMNYSVKNENMVFEFMESL